MRWDRLFEDLEDQLASEWEAERAALDSEAERLRLSKVCLRDRLASLAKAGAPGADRVGLELVGGRTLVGGVVAVGSDFIALDQEDAETGGSSIVRLDAVRSVSLSVAAVLRSARPFPAGGSALSDRLGFGFVLRDLSRRRLPVRVATTVDQTLIGTIDRVGVDHADIALHDAGAPRRAAEIAGVRLVPFEAMSFVHLDAGIAPALL